MGVKDTNRPSNPFGSIRCPVIGYKRIPSIMANYLMGESSPLSRAPDPDAERVRLARQGNYEAFEELVSRYERPMYNLAMRILRRREDAEDVVQQTFLSVLEHLNGCLLYTSDAADE